MLISSYIGYTPVMGHNPLDQVPQSQLQASLAAKRASWILPLGGLDLSIVTQTFIGGYLLIVRSLVIVCLL